MQPGGDRHSQEQEVLSRVRQRLYSARFGAELNIDVESHIRHYEAVLKHRLDFSARTRALDIGCGYGNLLAYYRHIGIQSYLGVDSSPEQIGHTLRAFGAEHARIDDGIRFLAESSPGDWDIISAIDFVEHLTKGECLRFLSLAYGAMSHGGILLIRTPNANAPWGMSMRYNDLTHEICFTPNSYKDAASACGFERIECWEDIPMIREGIAEALRWFGWQASRWVVCLHSLLEAGRSGARVFSRNMWAIARK